MSKKQTKSAACYGGRRAFVSECGNYVAVYWGRDVMDCDVFDSEGNVWRSRRYRAKGWHDKDRRVRFAEFPKMVTSWWNRGKRLANGRWSEDFHLSFSDFNQTVPLSEVGCTSNRHTAVFRRRVPPLRPRKWIAKVLSEFKEP